MQESMRTRSGQSATDAAATADRVLAQVFGGAFDNFNSYGCWCYFEDLHGTGRGKPVDDMDGFCKAVHMGYRKT